MNKALIAGPWIGEFGWELFCWQGFIRKASREYEKTYVITRPSSAYLYEDFATVWPYEPPPGTADCSRHSRGVPFSLDSVGHVDLAFPTDELFYWGQPIEQHGVLRDQEFKRYGDAWSGLLDPVIVFCPRNRTLAPERNWSAENWRELHLRIREIRPRASCIIAGTIDEALDIRSPGISDWRGVSLRTQCTAMRKAAIVIGPSSGTLHLAALSCAKTRLVWNGDRKDWPRYETHWNPFAVPTTLIENWQPSVDDVFEQVKQILPR